MYKKKGLGLLWAEKKETSRPLLFASYASNCGWKLGNKSVNVFAYAHDIVLLAPSRHAMKALIMETYSVVRSVVQCYENCQYGIFSLRQQSLFSPFNTKMPAYTKNIRNIERNPVVGGRTG